jgi:penicillin-binding protein 1A
VAQFVFRWTVRLGLASLIMGLPAGYFGYDWFNREILSTLPETFDKDAVFRFPCSVQVFAADSSRVDQFYLERRVWVPIDQLPEQVWQAFVASEDRRFFEHEGVDPVGIVRALVVNLRGGGTKQGGSTITQQLVKNLMVGKEKSYKRKLREAVLAYRLERELGKMQLLELYVNYIALGNGNYGVEAASQDYFGISARELNAGQAAMLAGLVPAPSKYSPRHNPTLAAQRREQVLRLMVDQGFVSAVDASQHLQDPVIEPRVTNEPGPNTAYLTETRREVRRLFGQDRPFVEGLQIHTALDPAVQRVAESSIREALADLEARQGARGPVRNIPVAARPAFLRRGDRLQNDPQTGTFRAPRPGECFSALQIDKHLEAGPFRFELGAADLEKKVRQSPTVDAEGKPRHRPPAALLEVLQDGDVLDVCVPAASEGESGVNTVHLRDRPWAEAAAVVIENATGHVVAEVGGYDVGLEGFVRATQAKRQPGSSFKPFVYAAAILHGHRQTDMILDGPFSIPGTNGRMWSPQNYDGKYKGNLPIRSAMALSLNTVAVRLGLEAGIDNVVSLASRLGVRTPLRHDLTVALGSSEVTPMDLAVAYSSLAREGVHIDPVYITRIEDRRGFELGTAGGVVRFPDQSFVLPGGPGERVMPQAEAYVVVDMMRNVFKNGTAKKGQRPGMDFAGKTGTTSNFVDAWFVGYSPRYTVAVWVGTDGTSSIGDKETGGKSALPAWNRIMEVLPNVPGERFPVPDGVVLAPWSAAHEWLGYVRGTVPADVLPQVAMTNPLPPFGLALPGGAEAILPTTSRGYAPAPDHEVDGDVEDGANTPGVLPEPDLNDPNAAESSPSDERDEAL